MSDPVTVEVSDAVATVTLNRPEVRNALSAEAADALAAAVDSVAASEARCLVLRGAGEAFCAGGDLDAMTECIESEVPPPERVERIVKPVNEAVERVYDCPVPTIAAVDGAAVGAGAGLAIACDLQVAGPDAVLSFGFRQVGLSLDSGVSYTLPRLVGPNTAKELVFTGELVDADRAGELGLVTRVAAAGSFEDEVADLARTIASGPPVALREAKRLLDAPVDSFASAAAGEGTAQGLAFATADHEEAVRAFREGRDPSFRGE